MKNTKANRTKFLKGYLKILLSWSEKEQNFKDMENALIELNKTLPTKTREVKLYKNLSDFWSDLWSDLGSNLGSDLWRNLESDLGSNLRSDLWSDLWSDLRRNLGNNPGNIIWDYYAFIWPIFVSYFYKNLPTIKKRKDTIEALDKCIKAGIGYLWLSSDTLYAIPFPKIFIDKEKRLHSETGSACEWCGGEKSWWIHGVKVTQKIVENPEKLTKKDWSKEKNLEIRRIIQERMGNLFPKKIGAKLLSRPSKEYRKHNLLGLYEVKLPNDPEEIARYVKVQDHSSKRQYFIRVSPNVVNDDPDFTLADESLASTFQMRAREYKPLQET